MRFELPILGFVAGAALCVAVWAERQNAVDSTAPELESVLGAIPPGADLVVLVDVERWRDALPPRSLRLSAVPFAGKSPLVGQGAAEFGKLCGFNPEDQARELAAAVRSGSDAELELFVATVGDFRAASTAACAQTLVGARGGVPERSRTGSFVTLRDAAPGAPSGMLAVRDGGPILLGEPGQLRAMVDTVDRRAPSLFDDPVHAALRRQLPGQPTLLATLVLQPGWPERWGIPELEQTPLSATRAASFGIEFAPEPAARATVSCPNAQTCRELATWLKETWARLLELAAKLELPVGDRLDVRAEKDQVELSAALDLELFLKGLESLGGGAQDSRLSAP